jgi:CPA2 family monovalent cation:H+ antiporter-2
MPIEFVSVLLLMVLAAVCVWGFKRINLPPILAYLLAGFIAGPSILGLFPHSENIHLLAEVGIVFLLFSLGLEFSLPKLIAMRHLVFGVGLAQMTLTTFAVAGIAFLFGASPATAMIIGGMVGLSSTAIVIKQTGEMKILNTPRSQLAVAVLLFQDLAVVPFLIIIPLLGGNSEVSITTTIILALGKGVLVVAGLLWFGKLVLPLIFREVARTRTDELFVLATIIVALTSQAIDIQAQSIFLR